MSQWVGFVSGTGIVPALSAVSRLLAQTSINRVWVFYDRGGSPDTNAMSGELEQLLLLKDRHMARLSLGILTEREDDEAALLSGRLDGGKIRSLAGRLFEPGSVDDYFICGPEGFATEVRAALCDSGVPPTRVHVERADAGESSGEAAKPSVQDRETQVSFVMDGRRRSFTMRTDEESILDAASRAGIELPFSCKAGVCATCRTKLVKGKVDLMENYALEDWELEQGFILACQARARTPQIELTYDEK